MLARLARAFLVVALLAAWQAALLHPLQHVDSHGNLVHASDRLGQGDEPASGPSDKLCDALAALMACASESSATLVLPSPVHEAALRIVFPPRSAQAPPFLAQAPPALL